MASFAAFDSFQGDFNVKEYISKICLPLKIICKDDSTSPNELNCLPYIEAFEINLLELKKFYLTLENRVENLSQSLESDYGEFNQKISSLGATFDTVFGNFACLNQASEKISGTALRIGKQLEAIQSEKSRAEESREILSYYLEFNASSKCGRIDSLMLNNSFDSRLKLANLFRKLIHLANAEIEGAENANSVIKSKFSAFENEALTNFMVSFGDEDIAGMKDSSSILFSLNDASSCVKIFIEKHAFFQEPYNCSEIIKTFFVQPNNSRIPIDFSKPALIDSGLASLFDLILKTISADWVYLEEIFDSPRRVMDSLLKRVFEEIIMRHIDEGLKCAGMHSTVQYLRYLSSTYIGTLDYIDDLLKMYREHMEDLPVTSIDGAIEETRSFLISLHSDIFSRYTKHSDIQMLESRFIKEVIDICSIPIQNYVNSKKISKSNKNIFNISSGSDHKIFSDREIRQRCEFYNFADGSLINDTESDKAIISSSILMRILFLISEAISRITSFYEDKQMLSELLENYLTFFFELFRKTCITPVFLFIVENEDIGCLSKPFNGHNFSLMYNLNSSLSIIQLYFEEHVIPISSAVSPTCTRKMFEIKNSFFESCLRYINKVLKLEINGISLQLNNIAQKLVKKSDYRPKADDFSSFNSTTQYCQAVREYLRTSSKIINQNLPKSNAVKVLNRIGKIFFEQLIEMIKKITFNDVGALVLLNDINSYLEMLEDFGYESQNSLVVYFKFLRELSNILLVKPENLRSVLQEGSLNLVDIRLFYPFIALRADFRINNIDNLFPEMSTSSSSGISTNGLF